MKAEKQFATIPSKGRLAFHSARLPVTARQAIQIAAAFIVEFVGVPGEISLCFVCFLL